MAEGIRWEWLADHTDDLQSATTSHLQLVGASVGLAVLVAVPIAVAVRRSRIGVLLTTGSATVLYTIPSLALFALLVPIVGIRQLPAIIGLAVYALGVLVRNTVTGLREVPSHVMEAARGMGLTRRQILFRVELPLAVPAILTGVRLATVETVAIATIATFVGGGGLGELIYNDGIQRDLFLTPIFAGTAIAVVMAITFDALLITAQRLVTPWQAGRRRSVARAQAGAAPA